MNYLAMIYLGLLICISSCGEEKSETKQDAPAAEEIAGDTDLVSEANDESEEPLSNDPDLEDDQSKNASNSGDRNTRRAISNFEIKDHRGAPRGEDPIEEAQKNKIDPVLQEKAPVSPRGNELEEMLKDLEPLAKIDEDGDKDSGNGTETNQDGEAPANNEPVSDDDPSNEEEDGGSPGQILFDGESFLGNLSPWDNQGSSAEISSISPNTGNSHIRATITSVGSWGAIGYFINDNESVDFSTSRTVKFAAKADQATSISILLWDGAAHSSGTPFDLTTEYQEFTVNLDSVTGVDMTNIDTIVVLISTDGTYVVDIDDIVMED